MGCFIFIVKIVRFGYLYWSGSILGLRSLGLVHLAGWEVTAFLFERAHVVSIFHRRPTALYRQAPWCCELGCEISFRTSLERALAELAGLQGPLSFFGPMCSGRPVSQLDMDFPRLSGKSKKKK